MIECTKFTSFQKNTLLGYADFFIPKMGLEIFGCQLHQKNGRRWVNLPSKEFTTPAGEKAYAPIVRFKEKEHQIRFGDEALKAIDTFCAKAGIQEQQQQENNLPF